MNGESRNGPAKPRLATVWLDGCSGCHMSFLDLDDKLVDICLRADLVYSPLVDTKTFPDFVDVTLVEGAVSSQEDLEKIKHIRDHTKFLVALGDCAVTANVPSMRNPFGANAILRRAYIENVTLNPRVPDRVVPPLLNRSSPVHTVVKVDVFVPGCPPSAETIGYVVNELLDGRMPDLSGRTRFGA
ncbi:MAG: NADP oxidoreductase [Anaerolineae bacterium]|nr:NADP oxidoreductase [Anaerolineae bacterium]